jgi:hypothetical protein
MHRPIDGDATMATPDVRPWIERLARVGYTAKGVVYLLIGLLAFQAAAGMGGRATDTDGAFRVLLSQPFGRALLALAAIGLGGYALWRAVCAAKDPEAQRRDWKRSFVRVGYAASAVAHAAIGIKAARLAIGHHSSRGDTVERWTAWTMAAPLGPWLVGLAALGVAGYGVAQIVRGLRGNVAKRLGLGELAGDDRRMLLYAARTGLVARGIVFVLMGTFLFRAMTEYDPSEAGGPREALQLLGHQPYAPFLLGGVALGLAAYGVFQLVKARFRVITAA